MTMERSAKAGILKKKGPSGCLVIKKKSRNKNSGGGSGGLYDDSKAKERDRLLETYSGSGSGTGTSSSSGSSDEDVPLEFMRRKVSERRSDNGLKSHKKESLENRECSGGRKRGSLELFDFDEYDEFDPKTMRNLYVEDRFEKIERKYSGNVMKGFGSGLSNRNFHHSGSGSKMGLKGENVKDSKQHAVDDDDDDDMPIFLLRSKIQKTAGEPNRVQGKNGVLKVMVKKKKKVDFSSQAKNDDTIELKEGKASRSDDAAKKDLFADNEKSAEKEKEEEKVNGSIQVYKSKKRMKKEQERSSPPKNFTPIKGKEGKAQRGGSTEKQKLREKLRGMLVDAGWTIDYRPRRNRDYLDAVYISPGGTAYWSITKAHEALKKQLEDEDGKNSSEMGSPLFAPLPEDLINKLTRQTKRKVKDGAKRKRKKDKHAETSDSDEDEESIEGSPKRKRVKVRVDRSSKGLSSKATGSCTLMVRGHDNGDSSDSDGYVPYSGKRTVLSWLIDSGKARLSEKVQYMNQKTSRVMLEGWITREGIHCGCCSKILTVSKFEVHAGSKLRQPFHNIFLESGSSLLQCQVDAWNSQDEALLQDFCSVRVDGDDPDDDTCGICGDGGDLICCDSCPSTFHQICMEIQELPSGNWHCANCTCKFCGSGNVGEENESAEDDLRRCYFCEKKYHKSCGEHSNALPLNSDGASFCGVKCQELFDHLQKILGVRHELEAGFSWSLIQRKDVSDASQSGFSLRVECNSKLAVALSIMDECFLPIIDRKSGMNLVHNVVYNCGSNFNRLNFRGFYTVILEQGDEIISAASIRLHGDRLAEMPFIGTREIYRRQGMCRRLLSAIETELASLKVGRLIIPTISEHMNTWIRVFDFEKLEDLHKKEMKSMNMLVFPGTDMLQKQLVKQENSDGVNVSITMNNQPRSPMSVEKPDKEANSDSGPGLKPKTNDEAESVDSPSPQTIIPPSAAVHKSDNEAPPLSAAVISECAHHSLHTQEPTLQKPEIEIEHRESPDNSECSPNQAETNACKIETPSLDSVSGVTVESSKSGNAELNVEVAEDAGPTKTEDEGVKGSESTHNQLRLPISSEMPDRQESSNCGPCLESKANNKVESLDSVSAQTTVLSMTTHEHDKSADPVSDAISESEPKRQLMSSQ